MRRTGPVRKCRVFLYIFVYCGNALLLRILNPKQERVDCKNEDVRYLAVADPKSHRT